MKRVTIWLGLVVWLLTACAALPQGVVREPSRALIDTGSAPLARSAAASLPEDGPHLSGFRLLPDGIEALATRLALVRGAQRSLDVQYYLIADDDSGRRFVHELELAAARGVRVRLLVDDLHAAAQDAAFMRLAASARADVRLFNPLPVRGAGWAARLAASLHESERVNRRMHDKLLVADNAWAVAGGRNVGDEYFFSARSDAHHFVDMDVLAAGAVVRALSERFDAFWNSAHAYPIESLVAGTEAAGQETETRHAVAMEATSDDGPSGPVGELARGRVELHVAAAQVLGDAPAKASVESERPPLETAMDSALQLFQSARSEVRIVSPYFIPGRRGVEAMRAAGERGVRVSVLTNSLAATDEPLAYWGFRRYRRDMLRLGVELTEIHPAPGERPGLLGGTRSSRGRLHAKFATVDQRWVLIGSMNMDARSSLTNTELSLLIDSPALARELAAAPAGGWVADAYRLRLDEGELAEEWVGAASGERHRSEPHVGWLMRLRLGLVSLFVPEDQL
jgi:cardiolipin synthase C